MRACSSNFYFYSKYYIRSLFPSEYFKINSFFFIYLFSKIKIYPSRELENSKSLIYLLIYSLLLLLNILLLSIELKELKYL